MNNGLVRYAMENPGFSVRRSPRFCVKGNVDEFLNFGRKMKKGLSNLGSMEVGFDSGGQFVGKSGVNKRVLRSSDQEKNNEISKKSNICKRVYPDSDRDIEVLVSGKESEGKKRVTRGSIGENADGISGKSKLCEKGLADADRAVADLYSRKRVESKSVSAKRVTRSSLRGNADEIAEKGNKSEKGLSDVKGAKKGTDLSKESVNGIEGGKKVTRGSIMGNGHEIDKKKCGSKKGLFDVETKLLDVKSCDRIVNDRGDEKERDFGKGKQTIGVKRKRNSDGEGYGWTQDQELALQRAYFAAKPTPNFWKRVSKLVPGKSAQDCFNKINADHLTPPHLRTRCRATSKDVSSLALSASKLLKPEDSKIGKITRRKQNGHLAQKTVRHILQKHYNVDQGYEADLFSVLESTFSPSTKSLDCGVSYSTPQGNKHSCGFSKVCNDKSSSGLKKRFSRFSGLKGESLVSPPVLKPVKNKALHEKYIDQLHCRDAKRRVACRKENPKKNFPKKTEPIKLLKDALVLDAKDFVHKFQYRMDSARREHSDDENESESLGEEDEED